MKACNSAAQGIHTHIFNVKAIVVLISDAHHITQPTYTAAAAVDSTLDVRVQVQSIA